jgi:hypothetical protein
MFVLFDSTKNTNPRIDTLHNHLAKITLIIVLNTSFVNILRKHNIIS